MGNEYAVLWKPRWLPAVAFPWRITIGTVVTFFVALLFPTPWGQVRVAEEHIRARSAHSEEGSHGM